ncbi:hypothetical protein SAMN05421806_101800 [Streptomyces indicus]|uniref:Uncharacterized protein n=1 Tax=Streptomyces indicus TaxID=417292 RepID=A0A1G8UEB8_9ACTN|nr:hypothetical protein SAMN05421806_101800 [Streptomyces indicus]
MLLVLAVLTGVLGMHALPPGGAALAQTPATPHAAAMAHTKDTAQVPGSGHERARCAHEGHGSDHLEHADGTCAATGIGSPYAPPALSPAGVGESDAPPRPAGAFASAERGRAPPDLAELQLLRI